MLTIFEAEAKILVVIERSNVTSRTKIVEKKQQQEAFSLNTISKTTNNHDFKTPQIVKADEFYMQTEFKKKPYYGDYFFNFFDAATATR